MRRRLASLALGALLVTPPVLVAQESPSVTLFANGRTLVRRTLEVRVPSGTSIQPLVLGRFDPSSFTVLDAGVHVNRIGYDAAFNEESLLRRNIGTVFAFPQGDGKPVIRARLVAMDPERWEILGDDGTAMAGVVFSRPGRLLWNPELVPLAPVADVTLTTDRARQALKVMYEAPGGSWGASYRLFLGADGRLEGTATIAAGTLDLAQAEVQLLAGDIGRRAQQPMALASMARDQVSGRAAEAGMASSESIGEVQLYTLPGRVTFVPGAMLALPLFQPAPVAPQLKLSVGGSLPFWGGLGQMMDEEEVPVEVSYRLERKLATPFGDLPLPGGGVAVYDTDKAGRVQLVGQGGIGHTGPGELFEVSTGTAFDVTARRTQAEFTTNRLANPTRTVANVAWSVTITNAKDTAVTVEVREDRGGEWSVVTSSVPPVRRSASRVVFPLPVPAKGSATLTYRLRVVW
jgi:hypothetical protein